MLVDSHCHLDFPDLSTDLDAVIARAAAAGIGRMVTISTYIARFETYRAIAEGNERVFFTVGTHPHNAAAEPNTGVAELVRLSAHPRCIAIGESGLDYHYDKSPRDVQRRVFRTHIMAARETRLPLVIHAREADDDMIEILTSEMREGRFSAVLHCFSSTERLARTGIELGLYVSFSGIVTFKRSDELREIAQRIPLERILVETDAPYLAPQPFRGKRNEPAYTEHIAHTLAETLGLSDEAFAAKTTENFYRLFEKAAILDRRKAASG